MSLYTAIMEMNTFVFFSREHQKDQEKHWNELKQYFGVNDRFQAPACSNPSLKVAKTLSFQLIC